MPARSATVDVTAIIPVGSRQARAADLYAEYVAGLEATRRSYEIIFVLDGAQPEFASGLRELLAAGETFRVIGLSRTFGEATALMSAVGHARGNIIVTLPAYHQIMGADLGKLLDALADCDLCVCHRSPRAGGWLERARRSAFHRMLAWVTQVRFNDLGCGARAFHRRVLEEIHLYGDQHRFLAVLANRVGFKVREIEVRQSPNDRFEGIYGPREYVRGFLDILTVFFLGRFTKKPLRFFGMIGAATFVVGALLVTWLVIERLFLGESLAERPALLLSTLLVVLGLQLFALGLLGELIIFTHARSIKDYRVAEIIEFGEVPVGRESATEPLEPRLLEHAHRPR